MIYLDNAATTFPKEEIVYEQMNQINRTLAVNSGRGSYKAAKKAADLIATTRKQIERLFNCSGIAEVVFAPSVTHAINQILYGLDIKTESVIYESIYEHNAVARTIEQIEKNTGCSVNLLPVNTDDLSIDIEKIRFLFTQKKPDIVIMNVISNVTGYRLPVEEVFMLAKEFGAITIADAAQAAGLIEIDYRAFHADIICFAGHKTLGGPLGIGGFVLNNAIDLKNVLTGGTGSNSLNLSMPETAPGKYEASSPNVVAIAGLNASLSVLNTEVHLRRVKELTEYLYEKLLQIPKVTVYVGDIEKCLGILSFSVEGYESNDVGMILDEEFDIAVRTGYHCAPFVHKYLNDYEYAGTVRVGIGQFNTTEELDCLIEALETL